MQTLCVVAHIRAKKEKQEELKAVLTALVAPTRKETGCIRYQLYRNVQDPQDFTFVEEWVNDAALELHLQTPHLKAALLSIAQLGEGSPSINRYTAVA